MKNIHILPTDKPSRLYLTTHEYIFEEGYSLSTDECENKHIYITSDEEIKDGDWLIVNDEDVMQMKYSYDNDMSGEDIWVGDSLNGYATYKDDCKKIILTTDQELIKDGVQSIPDEFLEWFVNNPSCDEVKVKDLYEYPNIKHIGYKIIIPKEEPKQLNPEDFGLPKFGTKEFNDLCYKFMGGKSKEETLEEVDENKKNLYYYKQVMNPYPLEDYSYTAYEKGFIEGYQKSTNYQQKQDKNKYSDEEVQEIISELMNDVHCGNICFGDDVIDFKVSPRQWFEQFKKK